MLFLERAGLDFSALHLNRSLNWILVANDNQVRRQRYLGANAAFVGLGQANLNFCLLYTSPSPRDS